MHLAPRIHTGLVTANFPNLQHGQLNIALVLREHNQRSSGFDKTVCQSGGLLLVYRSDLCLKHEPRVVLQVSLWQVENWCCPASHQHATESGGSTRCTGRTDALSSLPYLVQINAEEMSQCNVLPVNNKQGWWYSVSPGVTEKLQLELKQKHWMPSVTY